MLDMVPCLTCGTDGCGECNGLGFVRSHPGIFVEEKELICETAGQEYKRIMKEIIDEAAKPKDD